MCAGCVGPAYARRPEAPVLKVMLGRGSQCIRVLIPDDDLDTGVSMSCCLIEQRTISAICCGE